MVLDVPGPQHAAGLSVIVGVNHHGLCGVHSMVRGEHMLSNSRQSSVSVLQSPAVFTKTMVQGPTRLRERAKRGPPFCTSVSSPQLVCGLQDGVSDSTDTDLCGWPYGTEWRLAVSVFWLAQLIDPCESTQAYSIS